MPVGLWCLSYAVIVAFWLWIIRWDGAEWFERTNISEWIVESWMPDSGSAESVKVVAWVLLVAATIWFILGLAMPETRFWW